MRRRISARTFRCCSLTTTTIHASTCATATAFTTLRSSACIATILFASRGAALMYYGDEIGMKTTPPTRKEDVKDPIGITGWPKEKGRDGERTPMQWNASANAGFTTGTPWLPVPPSAKTTNVKAEESDPDSLLAWYKALIRLKKTVPAFRVRRQHHARHGEHKGV